MRKEIASQNSIDGDKGDFINVFGSRKASQYTEEDEEGGGDSDRELNEDERDILKQFEENDRELENIAAELVDALDQVKNKAENIQTQIKQ